MKFHACWIEFCSISKFSFISNKLGPLRPMRSRDFWKKKFVVLKFILRFQVNKWDSNKLLEASDWLLNGLVSYETCFVLPNFTPNPTLWPTQTCYLSNLTINSIFDQILSNLLPCKCPTFWFDQVFDLTNFVFHTN